MMKVQLCLSGGGARGFAHLGVVEALNEMGVEVSRISGTSAGAMAGAFLAAGYDPRLVLELLIEHKIFRMFRGAFNGGLLKMNKVEAFLDQYLPITFADLKLPMYIAVTDLLSGKVYFMNEGNIKQIILGSCSIPGLFKPVNYNQMLLVDGGVLNNLPIEPLQNYKDPIFGVHVNPVGELPKISSTWSVLERAFHLCVFSNTVYREAKCDLLIEPQALMNTKVFDYKKSKDFIRWAISKLCFSGMRSSQ
ncbi:MAG: patatin-like phospholipase family protein [Bacteroidetes bacterium]|nr:patatin-like phospholipase family protein [Bacteroidota bacterium]